MNPTTEIPKGTVFFQRKISDDNYGSTEAGVFIQFEQPDYAQFPSAEVYGQALIEAAQEAFAAAKATVYGELGVNVVIDASGQLTEALQPQVAAVAQAFPVPTAMPAAAPVAALPAAAGAVSPTPPFAANSRGAEGKANQEWAKQVYAANPQAFYDNRPKKASGEYKDTSPDLKHKDTGIGIWF